MRGVVINKRDYYEADKEVALEKCKQALRQLREEDRALREEDRASSDENEEESRVDQGIAQPAAAAGRRPASSVRGTTLVPPSQRNASLRMNQLMRLMARSNSSRSIGANRHSSVVVTDSSQLLFYTELRLPYKRRLIS